MTAFLALLRRDLHVYIRSAGFVLLSDLSQPVLVAVVFVVFFQKLQMVTPWFSTFVFPGLIAVTTFMNAVHGILFPLSEDLGGTREVDERLLAPISVAGVTFEKISVGMITASLSGIVTFPIMLLLMGGRAEVHVVWSYAVPVLLLCSLVSSTFAMALGSLAGGRMSNFLFDVIVGPMMIFGCAYYPWEPLKAIGAFRFLFLINPMVFMSEGLRWVLTPQVPHMPTPLLLSGLLVLPVILMGVSVWAFQKRTIL